MTTLISIERPGCGLAVARYLAHAAPWSLRTFGPGQRTLGIVAHIRKEIAEVEADPGDIFELADVFILALDGCWRAMTHWAQHEDVEYLDLEDPLTWTGVEDAILDRIVCVAANTPPEGPTRLSDIGHALDFIEQPPFADATSIQQREFQAAAFVFVACATAILAQQRGFDWSKLRDAVFAKLEVNMGRAWPDWRAMSADEPIEHVRAR